jgi:hypothetical protein
MKLLTNFKFYVVVSALSFFGLSIIYYNTVNELGKTKEELIKYQLDKGYLPGGDISKSKSVDSISTISDSLRNELFNERVESGRHEITREEVLSKYPNIKKEYESFYNHQTE